MDIKLPIKIHNRFDIEVKDITTGEIVQRGYAENIILDNYLTTTTIHSSAATGYFGYSLQFGRGTGILSPSRTTLFDRIGGKATTLVELVVNQPPLTSYATVLCTIAASEYIGETITEVGVSASNDSTIFTHALIKDSEGNPLSLGPKTNLQEILIYSTRYFVPDFGPGISFYNPSTNSFVAGFLGASYNQLRKSGSSTTDPSFYLNETSAWGSGQLFGFAIANSGSGKMILSPKKRIDTTEFNEKIKKITWRSFSGQIYQANALIFDFIAMAEGNSTVWSGYEFDKIPVGVGDGSQTTFNLTWDEVWMEKPKKVYIDGVEATSGFTFNVGSITFDIAPVDQAVITADYWVKYVPKDSDHVLDFNIEFLYGEASV